MGSIPSKHTQHTQHTQQAYPTYPAYPSNFQLDLPRTGCTTGAAQSFQQTSNWTFQALGARLALPSPFNKLPTEPSKDWVHAWRCPVLSTNFQVPEPSKDWVHAWRCPVLSTNFQLNLPRPGCTTGAAQSFQQTSN